MSQYCFYFKFYFELHNGDGGLRISNAEFADWYITAPTRAVQLENLV